jgi:hypothetical protein
MLRIVLDRISLRPDGLWEQRTAVSYKDFPEEDIREMAMQECDILSLGSFVLAELGGSLELEEES